MFKENIIKLFGKSGERWLEKLPDIIHQLSYHWQLSSLRAVENMSWNYVARGVKEHSQAIVIKITCDMSMIENEIKALKHFNGHGMVKLLAVNEQYHALLLEQAVPGESLQAIYPSQVEQVISYYANVANKLWMAAQYNYDQYSHIADWLEAIDHVNSALISESLLEKAKTIKNELLRTLGSQYLLHHDNIIHDQGHWLAIDPKGVIGEREFEVAAFDFIQQSEIDDENLKELFLSRVDLLALKLNLNPQRLADWVFVRLMLAACWMVEDNNDPQCFVEMAKKLI